MNQWFMVVLLLIPNLAWGKVPKTEHTFGLAAGADRPAASIEQVAWLAGSWQGTAFGQQFEEVWNPPSAGTMVGMFKLYSADKGVNFYEIMLITPQDNSLSLLVKHFTADFVSWESKEDHVNFKLVAIEDDAIHFSGLSFYRINDQEMHAYLAMRKSDGSVKEEKLLFKRL
ncbi:DUF6265 family protein [Marinicella meishanensis]|uniref:DUF6265 family protein n=1 Tax=Marinicella meishanensis TaxID=2873263 RepID=UPI001CC0BB44|nr:DUF6265 family protein [Marinicella sp. NBU2979]